MFVTVLVYDLHSDVWTQTTVEERVVLPSKSRSFPSVPDRVRHGPYKYSVNGR